MEVINNQTELKYDCSPGWRQLPRRSDLPPKPTSSARLHQLPLEILTFVGEALIQQQQLKSTASLSMVNKAVFAAVIPRLYHCIKLHSTRSFDAFYSQLAEWFSITSRYGYRLKEGNIVRPQKHTRHQAAALTLCDQLDRVTLYLESILHLDISAFESVPTRPARSKIFNRAKLKLNLDSLFIEGWSDYSGDFCADRLRDVFNTCKAKHLRWRGNQFRYDSELINLYLVPWCKHACLESLDIPTWAHDLPVQKARWLFLGPEPDTGAVILDLATKCTALFGSRMTPAERKSHGGFGPAWLLYNIPPRHLLTGDDIEHVLLAMSLNKLLRDWEANSHFITDYHFAQALDGDSWRAWLKKDIWSASKDEGLMQKEGSASGAI